jgi:GntP family gluconate:H+ symporter
MLGLTGILGNPNLALLLSAAISIGLVVRYRRQSLSSMSESIEQALMGGGVVILITAAGGAFGKMLAAAGIQSTIQSLLGESSSVAGSTVLLSAFGVASLLKFAQGSGTVSMITTSSMFAAMGFSSEQLGFNLVYLATAIGSGSLVGDWMNNSGFWVFSKMSVLTTEETLRTWSILTASLGFTGLVVTLLASWLVPLI